MTQFKAATAAGVMGRLQVMALDNKRQTGMVLRRFTVLNLSDRQQQLPDPSCPRVVTQAQMF